MSADIFERSHIASTASADWYRCSQPSLRGTSHKVDRASTSLLGTTRPQPQRELRSCTSLLGTALHNLQERTPTLTDQAQGQGATSNQDALMPDPSMVHDIATPRRAIGGRCCKWCISTKPASGKRKCAAFCMCGTRFTHGEARLQQWGNRETNHHYVHAHCVNGGLGHDHELLPKLADDQEAVVAVTRQRDTMTRTVADTEVLLPFAQDRIKPQQLRHLMMSETCLGVKRLSMDFQWFERVTWDGIKDPRGTTYVQPPTRFRFALQQAQHAILRAIIHNTPTSLASESAWKALVLSSWLLLGRPAVNASESNCAHFLDVRLEFFWAEDWFALWVMVRAE